MREKDDPTHPGELNLGSSVYGHDGSASGGFVTAVKPGGPGYVLSSEVPSILKRSTAAVADASSEPEPKRKKLSKKEQQQTAKTRLEGIYAGTKRTSKRHAVQSGEISIHKEPHPDYLDTKRDKDKYLRLLPCGECGDPTQGQHLCPGCLIHMHHHCGTPVEGEELPGQSVWCKNCAPRIVSSAPLNPGESRASTKVSKQEKSAPKKNATTSDARKLAAAKKSKPTSTSLHPSSTASTASTTQKSAAKTSAAEVPAAEVSAAATL
ncbi:UNVERIFIED_CONTAM: hypothetical protein HDU68_005835, partial [Siphonaria sp. JEL0065]